MANAQEKRQSYAKSDVRKLKRNHMNKKLSLPRGYYVESDDSEILSPDFFKAAHPLNPSAAKQAEKEYIADRWRRYPGKVYDRRVRPILIDSLKEHHRKIEQTKRDEFNKKWQLYLDREEKNKQLQNRLKEKKIVKETIRLCQLCNNFAYIADDNTDICGECMRSNSRNQPAEGQRRRRYHQVQGTPVYPSAIPLPPRAAHKKRKYQPFQSRVYPPPRIAPSEPLAITERQPYSFDMANFPQDLESFPLDLPEQEYNYNDQDWRYTAGTMEDLDKISNYFVSKSYMPEYNEADFKD